MQSQLETNQQEKTAMREQLEGLLRKERQRVTEVESLLETNEQEIIAMKERLKTWKRRLRKKQQKVTELQSQLETNHHEKIAMKEQLEQILREEQQRVSELQSQLERNQEEMNTMRKHLGNLHGQVAELQSQLKSNQQEMRIKREHWEGRLQEEQQRVTDLESQLETNQQKMTTMKERLEEEQQRVTDLESQLETNQQERRALREKFEERLLQEHQRAKLQFQLITKQQEKRAIGEHLQGLLREKKRVNELQSQLETKEQEMTAMREQFERRLREEQQRVAELRSQLERKEQEITAMREKLEISSPYQRNHTPDWVISANDIQITGQELGRGAWGTVSPGKLHGNDVAVKELHKKIMCDDSRRLFEQEVDIAWKCRHPCLLLLIGATIDNERLMLVTEIMECSLRARLQIELPLSTTEVCIISLDVARALNYLHQKRPVPIVHNDISSANVLLWRHGDQWRAKLGDYGNANFVHQSNINNAGAIIYCAPEYRNEGPISCKVDVYSFGVLLCEMCTREQPDPKRRYCQMAEVRKGKFQNLVRRCITRYPEGRPDMKSVIEDLERPEIEEIEAV